MTMRIADCGLRIAEWDGKRGQRYYPSWSRKSEIQNPKSAFTLIELLVAVGLMALLLTMIAQVFYQATQSFRMAKASVEIHQNARAAFDIMLRDLAAAEFCSYENKAGYFALSVHRDAESGEDVQAVTFTTLADQSGAAPLVPGVSPQVALVRYTLQFDGGNVTLDGVQRSTYNLVKQVRFPQLVYPFMDMNEFDDAWTPDEIVTTDILALSVLDMNVRFLCGPNPREPVEAANGVYLIRVHDFGHAEDIGSGPPAYLQDTDKAWSDDQYNGRVVRLLSWEGAGEYRTITDTVADDTLEAAFTASLQVGETPPAYRIEDYVEYGTDTTTTTVSVTNGSQTVAGNGTNWLGSVSAGDVFICPYPGGESYVIQSVDANTQITLTRIYAGATANPENYVIFLDPVTTPTWTDLSDGYAMKVIEHTPPMHSEQNIRMPYLVEVTLEVTDSRGMRRYTFTERFFVPSSEW